MFSLIGTLISGLVVGVVAKFLMPGKDPGGMFITILLGIAGSVLGSWGGQAMGLYGAGESAGFVMSVAGAIVLLFAYRTFRQRSA
ncbi:MAG: GlsB/YeaQ/YmgE family stress response membrane protein [Acidobacteria bacterium]|nr:GlsB/YeaQ/YmgE family stress response membrane protein [Acidobacteriota bacterium]